jgi:putative polyhydroxyalkanoate system protein
MSKVSIARRHGMGRDQLVSEIEQMAEKLVAKYGGSYSWKGNELTYNYSGGVTACVHCAEKELNVDVKFGMLMSMLKGPITKEIEDYLDKHLS